MDQRQAQADAHAGKADCRLLRGRTQNHQQEDRGQHHFGHQGCHQVELAGRVLAIAVGGQVGNVGARLAGGDQVERCSSGNRTQHLGDDVARQLTQLEAPGCRQAHRHRRVEMPARHRAKGIGAGQHRQAKGEGDAEQTDTDLRKSRRQHGAAAAAKGQPECPQKLCRPLLHLRCHTMYSPLIKADQCSAACLHPSMPVQAILETPCVRRHRGNVNNVRRPAASLAHCSK